MKTIQLSDLDIYDFGLGTQIDGLIWSNRDTAFVTILPNKEFNFDNLDVLPLTLDEWLRVFKQTDLIEVEMFTPDETGKLVKAIVRKTQRQIDTRMQWAVFARDNYTCCYCGKSNTAQNPLPLTVDHIDLWEDGGITHPSNLLTACRACNSDRGRLKYEEWIKHPIYLRNKKKLSMARVIANEELVDRLPALRAQRVQNVRKR